MSEDDKSSVNVRAPEFPEGLEWINTEELSLEKLKGKTVLVDFWDYTCINCIRTLPYLKEWYKRYARHGFMVIGVHTPEFDFAKNTENVRSAVDHFGIEYPVVVDSDYELWSLYANQYWPNEYLIDSQGYIVYDHAGEGNYHQTELFIQRYLERMEPGAKFPNPYTYPSPAESGGVCYPATTELYLGYERGKLGNTEGYEQDGTDNYTDPGDHKDGYVYAQGLWQSMRESFKHGRMDKQRNDYIAIKYHALSVNAVLSIQEDRMPYKVFVLQDDAPVADENKGDDLQRDEHGQTYFMVDEPRMYQIIRNKEFGSHELKLSSESKSYDIYSFTFGSCGIKKSQV